MQKVIGNIILVAGFLAFIYLIKYKGQLLNLKLLWIVISLSLVAFGLYIANKEKWKVGISKQDSKTENAVTNDTTPWKIIKLTTDNCEVKSRSSYNEILGDSFPSRIEMIDGLYDPGRNSKTEKVIQTYIVFQAMIKGERYKFISHATSFDKNYVMRELEAGRVSLLFNPKDPGKYKFETTW
jgi:hypothetical protein